MADENDQTSPGEALLHITPLSKALEKFAKERDWAQFHSPKNLVMALAGEVGELVEIFQWMTEKQSVGAGTNPQTSQAVKDELADVQLYLARLADVLGVDLNDAVKHKLQKNAEKYPIQKAKGSSKKYTEF